LFGWTPQMPMEKTFDFTEAEARIYAAWEKTGAFAAGANVKPGAEAFCVMIPPPNVTGSLHMGHAFNNTLQDILVRWHRMRGFDVLWQPGQDHAGIATQMVVERQMAAAGEPGRREIGREAFLAKVWQWKEQSGGTIINQLKRLGASCDWSRNRFTMDEGFQRAVLEVFGDMFRKGLIYRGKRLVNWDPYFETAISDLEVEQVETDGHMWRLRYPLEGGASYQHPVAWNEAGEAIEFETRHYLVVATTRPETMLGDTGIAVHPDDPRYRHLIGKSVRLPLVGRSIPIVADRHADPEKGTGAVKITPAHDFNDWAVGRRCNLAAINVMDTRAAMSLERNAAFLADADPDPAVMMLHGRDRYEAREAIIKLARDAGWLDGVDADRHMVPHGDRSKVAIEPRLTDQWFVDTAKIVQPAIAAVRSGKTRILPERDAKVYFHWLENIEPWCISRQLWWGHRIPVWYGPGQTADGRADYSRKSLQTFCAASWEEVAAEARAHYGVTQVHEKSGLAAALEDQLESFSQEDSSVSLWRDPDVLDTWFSSGLWPIGTLGWPEDTPELRRYFPTDVLVTGFDILFFWVARMMMMQLAVVGEVPFKTVYVHALVRDEKGKKMSKSTGNVLDPLALIDVYGADAVRFTLAAMAAMGRDLKLSTSRIAGYRNFGTKLWNATRFAQMNGVFEGHSTTPPRAQTTVNRWIIGETARTREAVDAGLRQYRFNDVANTLYAFVWGKVCDWYVEFAKPLFADPATAAETRRTMAWVLDQCVILLHPIMPFITEEIWSLTAARKKPLIHADWPDYSAADLADADADREIRWVIALIEEIRSARAQLHVPAGLKLAMLELSLDEAGRRSWERNGELIRRLARIATLTPAPAAPKGSISITVEGGAFALPLAGVIDVNEERARLEKALKKLKNNLATLRGRLANPKFIASAPANIVAESREILAARTSEAEKIDAALRRLAEIS